MSKYFFQNAWDVITGQPTPAQVSEQNQANAAIKAISAAIPPPPPPPALSSTAASGNAAANAAAAAAGAAGFAGTIASGPEGAALPSTTGGKALLGG
jgi:hypothetical protein